MANNEVEMEDAHKPDSGIGINESKDKGIDFKIEMKGNGFPSADTVFGNANESENEGDDLKLNDEAEDQITDMSEMENKTSHESESNEPTLVEGIEPAVEQIDAKSFEGIEPTVEQIDAKSFEGIEPTVEQIDAKSFEGIELMVEQIDTKSFEGIEPTAEQIDTKSFEGIEQTVEQIDTKSVQGIEPTDTKSVEGVEQKAEQIDTKSVEDVEPTAELIDTKSESEEGIITKANAEVQTVVGSIVDKLTDAGNEVVEKTDANDGLKEENPMENDVEVKVPVKSGDIAVGNPNDSKEDEGCVEHDEKKEMPNENAGSGGDSMENKELQTGLSSNETPHVQSDRLDEVPPQSEDKEMEDASNANEEKIFNYEPKQHGKEIVLEAATPNSLVRYLPANMGNHSGEADKTVYTQAALPLVMNKLQQDSMPELMAESDDGTPEDQAGFIRELEGFYRERAMDFKPPKFYGQPLNCLKLWRAVIRLGGYDRVTGSKLWRQVGESFHPPKTCTTVSWTFRIFYEKSLLEYERHKRQNGDLQLPLVILPEASGADSEGNGYQGSGSGRARRDAAARAMQGWHVQRLGYGEVGEPVIKDKNINNTAKREKNIKSIASLKQKRPNEVEHPAKAARTETSKQIVASVVDIGPPADWVKINIRQTKDCFEVYALVPGLLREEVRVQSDPAGRLVITGHPEQADNPWGITPFKKVVSLPGRIDPLHTSAVVSLHGRLFVRVPFESNS